MAIINKLQRSEVIPKTIQDNYLHDQLKQSSTGSSDSTFDTVQIRSKHGCHPNTHSKTTFDTVQIRSRHRCHHDTHSDSTFDTVQIHSRHGCHSDTHSDSTFDIVQIRSRHRFHSDTHSDFNFQIQFRYAPDTDAMLTIIQFHLIDTVQQSPLEGLFKPISNNHPLPIQMASLSPFPA